MVSKIARAQRKDKDNERAEAVAHLKRVKIQMISLVSQASTLTNGRRKFSHVANRVYPSNLGISFLVPASNARLILIQRALLIRSYYCQKFVR